MSDSESDREVQETPKINLETKTVNVKTRKPMTQERLDKLAEMRERAKLIAQAKRELREANPDVKEYNRRDPALISKIAELEGRGDDKPAKKVSSQKGTRPLSEAMPENIITKTAAKVEVKKPKNKRIVYVSDNDSSSSEEEVIIKKPKAKKQYQWTAEDIEDLKKKELEMRMTKLEQQDEFARMEKAMLQKRYADKLKEVQKSQLAKFMFGGK